MSSLANFVVQPPLRPLETFIFLLHRFFSVLNEQQVRIAARLTGVHTMQEGPGIWDKLALLPSQPIPQHGSHSLPKSPGWVYLDTSW